MPAMAVCTYRGKLLGNFFKFGTTGHLDSYERVHILWTKGQGHCDLSKDLFGLNSRKNTLIRSYYAFWRICLSFIVLRSFVVHVKGVQSEKAQSPHQRELPSRTEYTAHTLPEMPGLELSLYLRRWSDGFCYPKVQRSTSLWHYI